MDRIIEAAEQAAEAASAPAPLVRAFVAGFMSAGEGWNGEYPLRQYHRPADIDDLCAYAVDYALAEEQRHG